jgi:hypothetical protein
MGWHGHAGSIFLMQKGADTFTQGILQNAKGSVKPYGAVHAAARGTRIVRKA